MPPLILTPDVEGLEESDDKLKDNDTELPANGVCFTF